MQIVAEIGAGHHKKLDNVMKIISRTTEADAFKIQTWSKDTMAVPGRKLNGGLWDGKEMGKLYQWAHLPWEWHGEIFHYCRRNEIMLYSTPFDLASVDFLERLTCPAYKIASFEAVDLQLVQYIAQTGKPVVLSTGQLTDDEIPEVVETITKYNDRLMILHCVSEYPAPVERARLCRMLELKKYGFPVGVSDHSDGYLVPVMATALGASMVEKHVTLNENGPDGKFAMRPYQFNTMARKVRVAGLALQDLDEPKDLSLRRSLYWAHPVGAGNRVAVTDLKTARPNEGLSPLQIKEILGRKLTEDVSENQPVTLDQFG